MADSGASPLPRFQPSSMATPKVRLFLSLQSKKQLRLESSFSSKLETPQSCHSHAACDRSSVGSPGLDRVAASTGCIVSLQGQNISDVYNNNISTEESSTMEVCENQSCMTKYDICNIAVKTHMLCLVDGLNHACLLVVISWSIRAGCSS